MLQCWQNSRSRCFSAGNSICSGSKPSTFASTPYNPACHKVRCKCQGTRTAHSSTCQDATFQTHATYQTQVRLGMRHISCQEHGKNTRAANGAFCFAAPFISWPLILARLRRTCLALAFAHAGRHTAVSRQIAEHALPQPAPDAQSEAVLHKVPAPVVALQGRPRSKEHDHHRLVQTHAVRQARDRDPASQQDAPEMPWSAPIDSAGIRILSTFSDSTNVAAAGGARAEGDARRGNVQGGREHLSTAPTLIFSHPNADTQLVSRANPHRDQLPGGEGWRRGSQGRGGLSTIQLVAKSRRSLPK